MPFQLMPYHLVLLPLLGVAVATVGTLAGLGGGFILVPVLMFMFPEASPTTLTTISLTVVCLNALSATFSNLRRRRIDFRTALVLVVGATPAAVLGATTSRLVGRGQFEGWFGVLLLLGSVYILWRGAHAGLVDQRLGHEPNRRIQERRGPLYLFYVNGLLAGIVSPVAGFVSSFFGIGGGVIHVPALSFILRVPLRIAAATSLLVLVFTSVTALSTLALTGAMHEGWRRAALLGVGALVGGQLGVYLEQRLNPRLVLFILSAAMAIVGARLLVAGFQ